MDHRRALRAAIQGPPAEWKRPRGRPRQTWSRTVENDLTETCQHWSAHRMAASARSC